MTCLWVAGITWLPGKPAGFTLVGNAPSVRIQVEIQNNIVLVPIRINGSFEMNFILDTGVKTTILTEPLLSAFLNLDSLSRVKVRGLGEGDAIEAFLARNVSMSLPGVQGYGINMLVLPEGLISYSGMFGKPVYGIIGYELFGQFVVEINYHQKYIRLHDPFQFRLRGNWDHIPIDVRRSKPYLRASLVDFRGDTIESEWLIDTGASMAISLFDRDLPLPDPSIEAFLGQGLSGNVYGKLGRSKGFMLGSFSFEHVVTGYPDPESINYAPDDTAWYGNLGAEILSRFHLIIDYNREVLHLRKSSGYKKPFEYNISGLELLSLGSAFDHFIISYVRPKSPAEQAGLQTNDILLSINGIPAGDLKIDELYEQLNKQNGRMVHLRCMRGGEIKKISFRMEPEI
ncbi:MAG: aspartyl protease family protein [Bacteroidia bacterium]|nr:aspartyl protease family protein [Bacteroidia bacterium]